MGQNVGMTEKQTKKKVRASSREAFHRSSPRANPKDGRRYGLRPLLFVLDDYNAYIGFQKGFFSPLRGSITPDLAAIYGFQPHRFGCAVLEDALANYCKTLNGLMRRFEVRAPVLWTDGSRDPDYTQVAQALPLALLDELWLAAAAILVDLEWLPSIDYAALKDRDPWSRMGSKAVRYLSRRYPEVPCFLITDAWSMAKLQEGLVHGAAWCFEKQESSLKTESEALTCEGLEHRLQRAADLRYGAFPEAPFPDQLRIDPASDAGGRLLGQLGLRLPLDRSTAGRALQRSIATLFPRTRRIKPVRVFGHGRSAAAATFLASTESGGGRGATRFIKVGPWPMIQREGMGYRQVMEPRLNSHVANLLETPVVTSGEGGSIPQGAIAFTLAGLPEEHGRLKSLGQLIDEKKHMDGGGAWLAERIHETFRTVLAPLYDLVPSRRKNPQIKRTLWEWLGEVLPPVLTGVLIPSEFDWDNGKPGLVIRQRRNDGLPEVSARILAARELDRIPWHSEVTLWHHPDEISGAVELSGFELLDVKWRPGGEGELTLRHPDLGFRVRLRGKAFDLEAQFGRNWSRPGMSVTMMAWVDRDNQVLADFSDRVDTALRDVGLKNREDALAKMSQAAPLKGEHGLPDPLEVVAGEVIGLDFPVAAKKGPIHGDLNLQNILFAGEDQAGWLIDFEFAREDGMVAFDVAKLEVEIWRHHLLPELVTLLDRFPDYTGGLPRLLEDVRGACGDWRIASEVIEARLRQHQELVNAPPAMFRQLRNLVAIIASVRKVAIEALGLSPEELSWALAGYFLASVKFEEAEGHWNIVVDYLLAARHFAEVLPVPPPDWSEFLAKLAESQPLPDWERKADGLLRRIASGTGREDPSLPGIDQLASAMARNRQPVEWPDEVRERWDLASTGGVANISPILGYLWLRAKAQQSREGMTYPVAAPKISSRGNSCGTVDILESGGARFLSESGAIVDACRHHGGVLCRQDERLSPVDKRLMDRRRATGTMKNAALTYASIIGKKIAMGCTHAVVDVKLGRDTKLLAPWQEDGGECFICREVGAFEQQDDLETFKELLEGMGVTGLSVEQDQGFLRQTCAEGLRPLIEVRWVLTNGDMPQCRAIGRQLILLHLDQLIAGSGGEDLFCCPQDNTYKDWYCRRLPQLCGISTTSLDLLRNQWRVLSAELPMLEELSSRKFVVQLGEYTGHENFELVMPIGDPDQDLAVLSTGLAPYGIGVGRGGGRRVRSIGAYGLDRLFAWLGGEKDYDPEVGIWLHRLPGEVVRDVCHEPFISVIFHPSIRSGDEVLSRLRSFLREGVVVGEEA